MSIKIDDRLVFKLSRYIWFYYTLAFSTKAFWAHFRREKNYIFRVLTRNFRELTQNFRE